MGNLSTSAKVGLLTLAALIFLSAVIIWKTDIFMVSKGYDLVGSFNSIEGLTIGSEVRYRGFNVGKVMKIIPSPLEIKINAVVDKNIKFPDDSRLRISYDGIVGEKYLEIVPGLSTTNYHASEVIYGIKTSGIVDFVDMGTQNLQESKKILEAIRKIIEDPKLQYAISNTAVSVDKLTQELRETNKNINDIVSDPKFQKNIKGTIAETQKTLSSANSFFASFSEVNLRVSGGVDVGTSTNAVMGNVDIVQNDDRYFRFGMGEGQSSSLGLLDVLFKSKTADDMGFRLGVINNQLGGGIAFYPTEYATWRGDIYDINNNRVVGATTERLWPKLRLGYEYEVKEYLDLAIKADDLLNDGNRNVSVGILVKPPGERIY